MKKRALVLFLVLILTVSLAVPCFASGGQLVKIEFWPYTTEEATGTSIPSDYLVYALDIDGESFANMWRDFKADPTLENLCAFQTYMISTLVPGGEGSADGHYYRNITPTYTPQHDFYGVVVYQKGSFAAATTLEHDDVGSLQKLSNVDGISKSQVAWVTIGGQSDPTPSKAPKVKVSGTKATVSWTKDKKATGYKVYVSVDGGAAKVYTVKSGKTVKYSYKKINPGHTYTFAVAPVYNKTVGEKSPETKYTAYLTTPKLKVKTASGKVTVSWKTVKGASSIQVQIENLSGNIIKKVSLKGTATKYSASLAKGNYRVRVIARSNASVKTASKKFTIK